MVKLSQEFHTIKDAINFMNTLNDPLCSYVVPKVSQGFEYYQHYSTGPAVPYTTFFVVYYEHGENN